MYRIALGYDLHRLESTPKGHIICGGVSIPGSLQTVGAHSDGDVVFHALTDALLSVVGTDIGVVFSNTDPTNYQRNSADFLLYAYATIKELYHIVNIDIIVICDTPKISAITLTIRQTIASYLKMNIEDISIRGKTTEQTSPLTISAYSTVLFQKI